MIRWTGLAPWEFEFDLNSITPPASVHTASPQGQTKSKIFDSDSLAGRGGFAYARREMARTRGLELVELHHPAWCALFDLDWAIFYG